MTTRQQASLYSSEEHDACGVGFLARLNGEPGHEIVEEAITALARMAHRGGAGFGPENADGAGLLLPLPKAFMRKVWTPICGELPSLYALGHLFLPANEADRLHIEQIMEEVFTEHDLLTLGWRNTPIRAEVLAPNARDNCPVIRQCLTTLSGHATFSGMGDDETQEDALERKLYVARRHLEKRVQEEVPSAAGIFHVVSFSGRTVVYKGLLLGGQLSAFYQDLADRDFAVHFAVLHERYSTNTQPAWRLAQPFRCTAHNGEINTIACNQAHMTAREPLLSSPLFGDGMRHLLPVLDATGSDSFMLDNCLEFLMHGGRSVSHAAMMLMPEPFGPAFIMGEDKRSFYEYHASFMEPWDGPSTLVFTDGHRQLGAMLDRNALRPCRYAQTKDGLFALASEAGVFDFPDSRIVRRGRLQPRRMVMVDFVRHRVLTDAECKGRIFYAKPYRHWVREKGVSLRDFPLPAQEKRNEQAALVSLTPLQEQRLFGYNKEDLTDILLPMARDAQEPMASMGMDIPLAALSAQPQLLFSYLKQRFAQVTNPPIDPLREGLVMTLTGFAGKRSNLLEETPSHYTLLRLSNPLLTEEDMARLCAARHPAVRVAVLPMLFDADNPDPGAALERGLKGLFRDADKAISSQEETSSDATSIPATILLLTDADVTPGKAPIPSLLAVAGLHHHLMRNKSRHACSILVNAGDAREVMHMAQLIAFGASGIHPRVAFEVIDTLANQGSLGNGVTALQARTAYSNALQKGLLKTFSRMGISTLRSFMCGQGFEAIGLSREVTDNYFTGLPSRLGGIGLSAIASDVLARHKGAFADILADRTLPLQNLLPDTGRHKFHKNGERHLWTPAAVRALHKAVRENDPEAYREYAKESDDQSMQPVTLRGLLAFAEKTPISLEEVESVESIIRRFVSAAMSYGSISPEAHAAIAVACNRVGARSNCGEGGEGTERNLPNPDGSDSRSRIRQIASGRFGVTANYLIHADELQIKAAQGAKPGEGGQLPAHKVLPDIARVRHTIPGVTLISPPPHHDIYSIEDLAQLIFDLKSLHPSARVSVKLVAGTGVGTVAAGVAKAGADGIVISGHDGGTGASPRTAIEHVGLPWEMGLAEVQAALSANELRSRVTVQTDGLLRTGRDLVVAALLGAEEFGLGTGVLVSLGCCMLRVCHLGTCAVGIATQDTKLRSRFTGSPDHIERYFRFLAQDMREHMARLGFRTVNEMVGQANCLRPAPSLNGMNPAHTAKISSLDLSPLFFRTPPLPDGPLHKTVHKAPESPFTLAMYSSLMPGILAKRPCRFQGIVTNVDRAVGSRVAGEIARLYGEKGLPSGSVHIELVGTAGQSAGAFLVNGMQMYITGEANDYTGKGLSGGVIAVRPPQTQAARHTPFAMEQTAVGNVALYGATSGEAYFSGTAGERFAVRNSGAQAVVEGVGDHACEYMTGGAVVVLGATGYNFAAGMSGGVAYVYDRSEQFQTRCNMDGVDLESVWRKDDVIVLHSLISRHHRHTGSLLAAALLEDWQACLPLFLKVTPIEYRRALERMKHNEGMLVERLAATEEVYHR